MRTICGVISVTGSERAKRLLKNVGIGLGAGAGLVGYGAHKTGLLKFATRPIVKRVKAKATNVKNEWWGPSEAQPHVQQPAPVPPPQAPAVQPAPVVPQPAVVTNGQP